MNGVRREPSLDASIAEEPIDLAIRRGRGLRFRVLLGLTGIVSALLGLSTWWILREQQQRTLSVARLEAAVCLAALAPPAAARLALLDLDDLDTMLSDFVLSSQRLLHPAYLVVLDLEGRPVTEAWDPAVARVSADEEVDPGFLGEAAASDRALWQQHRQGGGPPMLHVSVPLVAGHRNGTLAGVFSLEEPWREIRDLRQKFVGTAILALLATLAGVFFSLSRQVLVPVDRLYRTARELGRGNLKARASLAQDDELGQLGRVLDRSAAHLEAYTHGLERLVEERTEELREKNAQLEELARRDPLTGLSNRRAVEEFLDLEMRRHRRARHDLCLLMLDLDHFKAVNDTWGHPMGDAVLVSFAKALRACLRSVDLAGRWGGEEFIVLLLDTNLESGMAVAEKIRSRVRGETVVSPVGERVGVTVSIGLASPQREGPDLSAEDLVTLADKALYEAKTRGRDRVVAAVGGA